MISGRKYLYCPPQGNYQLVMKVPSDLQHILDAKWIKRSLKTSKLKDAEIVLNGLLNRIHTSFALLRSGILDHEQTIALRASILPSKLKSEQNTTKSLSQLIAIYSEEQSPKWSVATKSAFERKFEAMVNTLGNKDVTSYSREDFLTYRGKLIASGYQPKTVNVRISLLSSLLKWGVRHGYLQHNHSEGMLLRLTKAPDEQRKVYAPEDLKLFRETLPRSSRCPWQYWIPTIAMYSGMRREEICQLRGCDIMKIKDTISGDDIWCFRITADSQAGLKVKTESSSRVVPIHSYLISQGLLDFTADKKADSNLWGFKRYNSTGEFGKKFGNWFCEFNRKHITDDPLKCFHSFRHTFVNHLKQKDVQESVIAEVVGHSFDSITMNRYGKKYQPGVLLKAVSLVDYSG